MCEATGKNLQTPAEKLASLLEKETGTRIDARMLRLFIKAKWDRITVLAHAIHEAE